METIENLKKYTFDALLENSVKKFSDRPALGFVGAAHLSYAEVAQTIAKVKQQLYQIGIQKGDKVAIYAQSMPHWGIAYFAIVNYGAIAVHLLNDFSSKETQSCVEHSGAKAIFVSEKLQDRVTELSELQSIIKLEDFSLLKGKILKTDQISHEHHSNPQDTASIIYTSGTTGRSKGVELSHENLIFTAIKGQACQRINKYDVALSILPMAHVYEFTIGFLMFFLNGAEIKYLQGPPVPRILIAALQKVRPTMMLSVPLVIEKIYKQKILPAFSKNNLTKTLSKTRLGYKILCRIAGKQLKKTFGKRIKFFGLGGAKTDPIVEQFMKNAKFPYAIGYGLTETAPLIAFSAVNATRVGELGIPLPNTQIKILNPDPTTGVGELVVKGKNVMKGYYNAPELTQASFTKDGWFKTGDLCLLKENGRLVLKGRSKNMILSASGENIYPEDIEFVLNQHPLVSESLVVEGEKDSLVAYVKVNEEEIESKLKATGGTVSHTIQNMQNAVSDFTDGFNYRKEEILNEIKFFVNQNVNRFSRIEKIEPIKDFEKTASQKIKRYLYAMKNNKEQTKKDDTIQR